MMTGTRLMVLAAALVCLSSRAGSLEFDDDTVITLIGLGTLDLGAPGIASLSLKFAPEGDGAIQQDFVLTAALNGHKESTYNFSTGYPNVRLYAPMLKAHDWSNIVLVTQEGHGTSASSWYLYILAVTSDGINVQYHRVIGSYFGSGEVWMYGVHFYSLRGMDAPQVIELELDHSPLTHDSLEDIDEIPKEQKLTISWDSRTSAYVEKAGWVSDSDEREYEARRQKVKH